MAGYSEDVEALLYGLLVAWRSCLRVGSQAGFGVSLEVSSVVRAHDLQLNLCAGTDVVAVVRSWEMKETRLLESVQFTWHQNQVLQIVIAAGRCMPSPCSGGCPILLEILSDVLLRIMSI